MHQLVVGLLLTYCACVPQSRKQIDPYGKQASVLSMDSSSVLGVGSNPVSRTHMGSNFRDTHTKPTTASPRVSGDAPGESRWGASYPAQIGILLSRTIKTRRFEALGKQDVIQFLIVGILSGECCPAECMLSAGQLLAHCMNGWQEYKSGMCLCMDVHPVLCIYLCIQKWREGGELCCHSAFHLWRSRLLAQYAVSTYGADRSD